MKVLSNRQLQIIEPLKKVVSQEFYDLQVKVMLGLIEPKDYDLHKIITKDLTKKQIIKCGKVADELKEHNKSIEEALIMIDEGNKRLRELIVRQ